MLCLHWSCCPCTEHCVPSGALVCHMVSVALCKCFDIPSWISCVWYPVSCSLSSPLGSIYCPFPGAALPSLTSHACLSVPRYFRFPSPLPHSRASDPAASGLARLQMQGHAVRQRGCQFRTSPTGSEHSSLLSASSNDQDLLSEVHHGTIVFPVQTMVCSLGNYWSQI